MKYPKYVRVKECNKSSILNTSIEQRNILHLDLNNRKQHTVLGIFMNPSTADFFQSDDTINDFIKYVEHYELGVRIIKVVNIFPFYETNPDNLHKIIKKIENGIGNEGLFKLLKENLKFIFKEIEKADKIIIGWGNYPKEYTIPMIHRYITSNVLERIKEENKKIYSFNFQSTENITKFGQPSHLKNRNKVVGSTELELTTFYGIRTHIDKEFDKI